MTNIIPVTYGYPRVRKTDDVTRIVETHLQIMQEFRAGEYCVLWDEMGSSCPSRPSQLRADIERRKITGRRSTPNG